MYGEGDNEGDNTAYDYNTNTEDDYNTEGDYNVITADDYNTDDYNTDDHNTANEYGDYNEEDNTGDDYNDYNYDAGEFTTDEPTTEDDGAVIIGSVDTSEEVTGGPVGPGTTTEPGEHNKNLSSERVSLGDSGLPKLNHFTWQVVGCHFLLKIISLSCTKLYDWKSVAQNRDTIKKVTLRRATNDSLSSAAD